MIGLYCVVTISMYINPLKDLYGEFRVRKVYMYWQHGLFMCNSHYEYISKDRHSDEERKPRRMCIHFVIVFVLAVQTRFGKCSWVE